MECFVASSIATLNAGAHWLAADIAKQLPTTLRYLLDVHHRLHECVISKVDLWDPHGTKEMSPSIRGLFKGSFGVWAEYTGL